MNVGYKVEYYVSLATQNPVKEFLDSLSPREQTKILRIFQYLKDYGLQAVLPHIKKLSGTLFWEIRILGNDSIRILYIIPQKEKVLILHGFIKKSQKTPISEINIATKRYEDWLKRQTILIDK